MRFGIQLYPPRAAPEMAAYAAKAMAQHDFAKVWVPDHLTYENVFVILAAILTRTDAHVGSSVVQPFSRTPIDLASSLASLAPLAAERGIKLSIRVSCCKLLGIVDAAYRNFYMINEYRSRRRKNGRIKATFRL